MNDDFLSQFREAPREEFARTLYARLAAQRAPASPRQTGFARWRMAFAVAALCVMLAATLAAVPATRAAVVRVLRELGGLIFQEMNRLPVQGPAVEGGSGEIWSPAEAEGRLPFHVRVPDWAPDGFAWAGSLNVWLPEQGKPETWQVLTEWTSPNQDPPAYIILSADYHPSFPPRRTVGEGSVEQLKINGKDVALVRGIWGGDPAATETPGLPWQRGHLTLTWVREEDGVAYSLEANEGPVTLEDLVQMVQTIR